MARIIRIRNPKDQVVCVRNLCTLPEQGALSDIFVVSDSMYNSLVEASDNGDKYSVHDMPINTAGDAVTLPTVVKQIPIHIVGVTAEDGFIVIDWDTWDAPFNGLGTAHVTSLVEYDGTTPVAADQLRLDQNYKAFATDYVKVSWYDSVTSTWHTCTYKVAAVDDAGYIITLDRDRDSSITAGATVTFIEGVVAQALSCT